MSLEPAAAPSQPGASSVRTKSPITSPTSPAPMTPLAWGLLGGIVLLALAYRLECFVGMTRLDMFRYTEISNHVLNGGGLFDKNVFYYAGRISVLAPLILANKLFGYGQLASMLWPLVCSLVSVVAVFFLGRELYDERVGLIAAFAMAIVPLQVELATELLPDAVESAFLILAILFGVMAITRDRHWKTFAILSGVALALAYFARVNIVVFAPGVLAIGAVLDTRKWKRSLFAVVGFVGVLAAAAVLFWVVSGDPLADWHKTGQFYASYEQSGFGFRGERFWRQLLDPRQPATIWIAPSLLLGTVWALIRRADAGRASWLLMLWAYGFLFYLDVISPLHGLESPYRYLEPMSAPALILGAAAVVWLVALMSPAARWVVPAVLIAALLAGTLWVDRRVARIWRGDKDWTSMRSAAQYVLAHGAPEMNTYTVGPYTALVVNYFGGYRFGRDTVDSIGAPVNRDAHLFRSVEKAPPPGERAFWISKWSPPKGSTARVVASYPSASGPPMKVYEITMP